MESKGWKSITKFLIPSLAIVVLVGVGYGAWYFSSPIKTTGPVTGNMQVTAIPKSGTWSFDAPDELVFVTNDDDVEDLTHCIEYYKLDQYGDEVRFDQIEGTWSPNPGEENEFADIIDRMSFHFRVSIVREVLENGVPLRDSNGDIVYEDNYTSVLINYFTFVNPNYHMFDTYIPVDTYARVGTTYEYTFSVDLTNMFRYTSIDVKPIFLDRFQNIFNDLNGGNQYVRFEFIAAY